MANRTMADIFGASKVSKTYSKEEHEFFQERIKRNRGVGRNLLERFGRYPSIYAPQKRVKSAIKN